MSGIEMHVHTPSPPKSNRRNDRKDVRSEDSGPQVGFARADPCVDMNASSSDDRRSAGHNPTPEAMTAMHLTLQPIQRHSKAEGDRGYGQSAYQRFSHRHGV
jgi:hypothetical protein